MHLPALETERLVIRPFQMDDLHAIHAILDVEPGMDDLSAPEAGHAFLPTISNTLEERESWLEWTVMSYTQLARLLQPPYGDRAVALRSSGEVIGACGFVPCLAPFEQLPYFHADKGARPGCPFTAEFGLYYAISPRFQRRGYAAEAVRALVTAAFQHLNLKRVVAATWAENAASIGVMRSLGMVIERNPYPEPAWFQVVGILEQPVAPS